MRSGYRRDLTDEDTGADGKEYRRGELIEGTGRELVPIEGGGGSSGNGSAIMGYVFKDAEIVAGGTALATIGEGAAGVAGGVMAIVATPEILLAGAAALGLVGGAAVYKHFKNSKKSPVTSNSKNIADNTSITNYGGKDADARKSAENYLGRPLRDVEWYELVKATSAEAGGKNQTEVAMVMASILNRAKKGHASIHHVLYARHQFQAVTGTDDEPGPSANYIKGPTASRANQIFGAAENILPNVNHKQVDFTAASIRAYKKGTNPHYRDSLPYTVGASKFNTAAPTGDKPMEFTVTPNNKFNGETGSEFAGKFLQKRAIDKSFDPLNLNPHVVTNAANEIKAAEKATGSKVVITGIKGSGPEARPIYAPGKGRDWILKHHSPSYKDVEGFANPSKKNSSTNGEPSGKPVVGPLPMLAPLPHQANIQKRSENNKTERADTNAHNSSFSDEIKKYLYTYNPA